MNYFYMIVAALAATYAFTFGRWLINNGNKSGAYFVYIVVGTCLALPLFRIITAP